jgi:hypothetical protein
MGDVTGPSPDPPRWVRGAAAFFRGFQYLLWVALLALTIAALVSGSWLVAAFGAAALVWRIGIRRLVARNRREVDRWQRRGTP